MTTKVLIVNFGPDPVDAFSYDPTGSGPSGAVIIGRINPGESSAQYVHGNLAFLVKEVEKPR